MRPFNKNAFYSYVKELYKSQPWIEEIDQAMPDEHPEGMIVFGLKGKLKDVDGDIEAVVTYGSPMEDHETGETVTILLHIGQIERIRQPEIYATKFEKRLREEFKEMSDFFSIKGASDEGWTDLCFKSRYEVDRDGFDYVEIIDKLLGYMLEALPRARRLLCNIQLEGTVRSDYDTNS